MRTSIGPSAGGFTCSLALVKLPSTIIDTRSATPCPKSDESTAAPTLKVGVGPGAASLTAFELSSCAAPALPSELLSRECLSVGPDSAVAETARTMDAAVAAVTEADVGAAAWAGVAGRGDGASLAAATPGRVTPISGVARASVAAEESGDGALVPCARAAAIAACATASASAALGALLVAGTVCGRALGAEFGAEVAAASAALLVVGLAAAFDAVGVVAAVAIGFAGAAATAGAAEANERATSGSGGSLLRSTSAAGGMAVAEGVAAAEGVAGG
jgi:hypothetical protein